MDIEGLNNINIIQPVKKEQKTDPDRKKKYKKKKDDEQKKEDGQHERPKHESGRIDIKI